MLADLATIRPSKQAVSRRSEVQIDNRKYHHPVLLEYDGEALEVEYDIRNDKQVWIYDDKHRLICIAPLKSKKDWIPSDRRQEAAIKAEEGRKKRRMRQMELDRMEAALVEGGLDQFEDLDELNDSYEALPQPEPEEDFVDIDLHDFE